MRKLNGKELSEFIKERQAREVRALKQANGLFPKLSIVQCKQDSVIETYISLKKRYGNDIGIEVDHHLVKQGEAADLLDKLNKDNSVSGIIIQLPLEDTSKTDDLLKKVAPEKDVDSLGSSPNFEPATPLAILWLLSGYNVDLKGKKVVLVGRGKLVGAPLEEMLIGSGVEVTTVDKPIDDLGSVTTQADVLITATGNPSLIKSDMIKQGAVVVDAGVASEGNKTVGDVEDNVYERDDITITPKKGGVGPLTVSALFENVIHAVRQQNGLE